MADADTKPKRSIGLPACMLIIIGVYVLSFYPVWIGLQWLVHWRVLPRRPTLICFQIAYAPVGIAAERILSNDALKRFDRVMQTWGP